MNTTYIVFVQWFQPRRKGFSSDIKSKRVEVVASDILTACDMALATLRPNLINPAVSMIWPVWPQTIQSNAFKSIT